MGNVDWSTVPLPVVEDGPKKERPIWTVVFVVVLLLGVPVALAYVNYIMLSDRVRKIALAEGIDPMLVVQQQGDCFTQHVTLGMPASFAAFQTPPTSPQLGIATVDLDAYRACVSKEL